MAACQTCGEKAGMGRYECRSCESQREAAEAAAKAERAREAKLREEERLAREARELEERTQAFVSGCVAQMEQAHAVGLIPNLVQYRTVNTTFSIQSEVKGQPPSFAAYLADLSMGWEIIGMIPHTEGVALFNRTNSGVTSYAGGFGGLVSAVYMVMQLKVTPELLRHNRDYIEAVVRSQYEDGTSVIPEGGTLGAHPVGQLGGMSTAGRVAMGMAGGVIIGSAISDIAGMGDVGGTDAGFDGGDGGGDFGGFDF